MAYNYGQRTFVDKYFYWLLFVPVVALLAFTGVKLFHDLQTVPMGKSDSDVHWVDHSTDYTKDWGYYAFDGHKLAAISTTSGGDDFRAYLFCVNQETLADHDFDTVENAKSFVERVCNVNEIEQDGIPQENQ